MKAFLKKVSCWPAVCGLARLGMLRFRCNLYDNHGQSEGIVLEKPKTSKSKKEGVVQPAAARPTFTDGGRSWEESGTGIVQIAIAARARF